MNKKKVVSTVKNIRQVYRDLVDSGAIVQDNKQEEIVELLSDLQVELAGKWQTGFSVLEKIFGSTAAKGIYMHGGVGRGKSMLMDLFYDTTPIKHKQRVHFHAFMSSVHKKMHALRKNSRVTDPLIKVADEMTHSIKLLCFDEFQVTDITDAMVLGRLFTRLLDNGITIVVTSNRHPDDLYKNGLQRENFVPFISLIKDRLEVVCLDSPIDYRLQHLKSLSTVYFSPLGRDADKFIAESFAELTNNMPIDKVVIEVAGREVVIDRTHGNVALVSFDELCARPLGAGDYIEIAREFSTLIMENIPQLSKENRNEAKRFVNLIDEVYEHKVKFICSATTIPEQLYLAGDGSFEFARTVSRLIEMQSESYLGLEHLS